MAEMFDVVIIGGGASGLFLASQLPKGLSAAIIEGGERVGKKLLATGNGKCNLTNLDMRAERYNNPSAVAEFLDEFDAHDAIVAFEKMGLITKSVDGRIYPFSECASTVLDVLRRAVAKNGARILTSHIAEKVTKEDGIFYISGSAKEDGTTKAFDVAAKNVVLATGSPATFGRDGAGLYIALGHTARSLTPSLVPVKTERGRIKGLQGVRVKAGVSIGDRREIGEVLFKDFGVSGIAAFNASSEIARGRAKVGDILSIDFMTGFSLAEVEEILRRRDADMTVGELMTGTFHTRLQERIIDIAGCNAEDKAAPNISALARAIKNFELKIEGLGNTSLAQVMSGGLNVDEFDKNLMSKKVAGAYAIGEALDIDGDCGGYNLQWAWSSAHAVANALEKRN
ncbi:MAG: aminoacetone oxidase family FAD-binding enzyme [Bacteroides sp.]|nr:aminoacetone oxidase family FAD-binding enzyme [Bacillota bacterium]MCM1393752.1 aminoacetone oxidase family FAD-binding enzyme [[Eubacterium] siraeum]MCM1454947.1 aminoacetone oxidase family FAD-binding enzyme [Bacteroides sp.]